MKVSQIFQITLLNIYQFLFNRNEIFFFPLFLIILIKQQNQQTHSMDSQYNILHS